MSSLKTNEHYMVPGVVTEGMLRTIVKRNMESLRPPEGLKLTGNVDCNWRTFKQQFELYISAIRLENKPDEQKIALLLTIAGPNAIEMFNTFVFDQPDDDKKLEEVIKKFDAHCSPKKMKLMRGMCFVHVDSSNMRHLIAFSQI